jgi:UDP-N-acetylmuramyl-tripeptide synthetase
MRSKKIEELLNGLEYSLIRGSPTTEISGIATHSETVKKGDAFLALKGERTHGAKYINSAIRNGAVAVLCEDPVEATEDVTFVRVKNLKDNLLGLLMKFYGNPSEEVHVAGITGTNGKTTTAFLIHNINTECGYKSILVSSVEVSINGEKQPALLTTPDTADLFRIFSQGKEKGCKNAVMEVTSIGLEKKRCDWVNFDIGIFTNITRDHLDFHKTFEDYRKAKVRFFKELLPSSKKRKKVAILNRDDPFWKEFIPEKGVEVITFSISDSSADVYAEKRLFSEDGIVADVKTPEGSLRIKSRLIGEHNLYNILSAISYGISRRLPQHSIVKGIEGLKGVPGRLEKVEIPKGSVFVDYAHTPDALLRVLKALKTITKERLIVLFGCGGDRDKGKRPEMGKVACSFADMLFITSDNPRTEDPLKIIEDIMIGVEEAKREFRKEVICIVEPDRRKAIKMAVSSLREGDVLLIAGKGHERYQILKDRVIPFVDTEEVKKALEEMKR